MEELIEAFTTFERRATEFKSFIYQAERVSINSQDSIQDPLTPANLNIFNTFTVQLPKPCLNVKSLQLLRATIPNPVQNIPDSEATFWYYRIPNVTPGTIDALLLPQLTFGEDGKVYDNTGLLLIGYLDFYGNLFDTNGTPQWTYNVGEANTGNPTQFYYYGTTNPAPYTITYTNPVGPTQIPTQTSFQKRFLHFARLLPSWTPPELVGTQYGYNRTFTDYSDLVTEINKTTVIDPDYSPTTPPLTPYSPFNPSIQPTYIPNDIQFNYNTTYNKIQMTGLQAYIDSNGNPTPNPLDPLGNPNLFQYWYVPAGYEDSNIFDLSGSGISTFIPNYIGVAKNLQQQTENNAVSGLLTKGQPYFPYRTLNLRLGFTYTGRISDFNTYVETVNLLRPLQYVYLPGTFEETSTLTFNSYPDLVYTANVYIYTNVITGATQDTNNGTGLLAVVPMNTPNLGVSFYSSVINTPLTKIATEIYQLQITLLTDTGQPFYLPNSAIVNLEIQMNY